MSGLSGLSGPLILISRSTVKPGQRETYEGHLHEAIEMVRSEEPAMLGFEHYASDDGTEVATVQIHEGPESLDLHLKLYTERLSQRASASLDTQEVVIYGQPSRSARALLEAMAEQSPGMDFHVLPAHAGGFLRGASE